MGLDGVELVMAVEEEFQIAISDSEVAECTTVGKLVKLVHSRLRHSNTEPCPSQHSFYLARQKLISFLHIPREKIKPETKLEEIIPKKNRKRLWSQVTTAMAADGVFYHNRLVRPKWMTYGLLPAFFVMPCAYLLWIGFPFALSLISALPVFIFFERITRLFSTEFPNKMSQVKDLIKLIKSLNSKTWSEEEVFVKIRGITAKQLGIDESLVTLDAKFIDDLGAG
jgi:acyl carrier protein